MDMQLFNFTFKCAHDSCLPLPLNTDAKESIYCCKENYNYTLWLLVFARPVMQWNLVKQTISTHLY